MKNLKMISLATMALCAAIGMAQAGPPAQKDESGTSVHGRYGGGMDLGAPTLNVTASMVRAGGGAANFSFEQALRNGGGDAWVTTELSQLGEKYGRKKVRLWLETTEFAVTDSLTKCTEAGIVMPHSEMHGRQLGMAMVNAGVDNNHQFTSDLWMDRTESHAVNLKVLNDLDKQYGSDADADCHMIGNQFFFDLAVHLNMTQVKLAGFH